MNYSDKYLDQARNIKVPNDNIEGKVRWRSPSNIALIKYWGKRKPQLPMNPSISFTLHNSITDTKIDFEFNPSLKNTELQYIFEEKQNEFFTQKIYNYFQSISSFLPVIRNLKLRISSNNSFPHSAGIASSASAFSALALCLLDIESTVTGSKMNDDDFFDKASFLARFGSGSASRSLFGGLTLWGEIKEIKGSSDEQAVELSAYSHPEFRTFRDTILIVDDEEKKVSSSAGHALMSEHPFASSRFQQAGKNASHLLKMLKEGDFMAFIDIVEHEALSLHAMMLTSSPGYFLIHPNTIEIIERIREFRKRMSIPVGFTLDAGPNVHMLYPAKYINDVKEFIESELIVLCKDNMLINDCVGSGPKKI